MVFFRLDTRDASKKKYHLVLYSSFSCLCIESVFHHQHAQNGILGKKINLWTQAENIIKSIVFSTSVILFQYFY